MNKKTFTLEIELPERYENNLSEAFIKANIERAIECGNPCLWSDEYVVRVVEQTCGTSDSALQTAIRAVDLLKQASAEIQGLRPYAEKPLTWEIDEFINEVMKEDKS